MDQDGAPALRVVEELRPGDLGRRQVLAKHVCRTQRVLEREHGPVARDVGMWLGAPKRVKGIEEPIRKNDYSRPRSTSDYDG